MPEIPDIELYLFALRKFLIGHQLHRSIIKSPFILRTFDPAIEVFELREIKRVFRIGKRIIWDFSDDHYFVFHLMIAGRFHWRKALSMPRAKNDLAAFQFSHGTLMLTEASHKKRASLHAVAGAGSLQEFERGGLEISECTEAEFAQRLHSSNRTLKRALTDPAVFSGIGNAYSDEILIRARMSPFKRANTLDQPSTSALFETCKVVLSEWKERLIEQTGDRFPEKVTAFRPEMLAHGKFGQVCPQCGNKIQRVVYADNEMNYCPGCQTGGKILADRSLSRLLKDDWPKTIDELD
jgi:formamidopyrimidine-DNA glycosylase